MTAATAAATTTTDAATTSDAHLIDYYYTTLLYYYYTTAAHLQLVQPLEPLDPASLSGRESAGVNGEQVVCLGAVPAGRLTPPHLVESERAVMSRKSLGRAGRRRKRPPACQGCASDCAGSRHASE